MQTKVKVPTVSEARATIKEVIEALVKREKDDQVVQEKGKAVLELL
jgi:hypothetical protein